MSKDSNERTDLGYTSKEEQIIRDNYLNKTNLELKELLPGRSYSSIVQKINQLGLVRPKKIAIEHSVKAKRRQLELRKERQANGFFLKGYSGVAVAGIALIARDIKKIKLRRIKTSMPELLSDISRVYGIEAERIIDQKHLKKDNRDHGVAFCRQLFCYLAKKLIAKVTLENIASFIGYSDNSTVIKNIVKIKNSLDVSDPAFLKEYNLYILNSNLLNNGKQGNE